MSTDLVDQLEELEKRSAEDRVKSLVALVQTTDGVDTKTVDRVRVMCLELLEGDVGSARDRVQIGEALAKLGDPRLLLPSAAGYWATVPGETRSYTIARYLVTNWEYQQFVDEGGYDREDLWSDDGQEWLKSTENPWPELVKNESAHQFSIANQPVVGVTLYEANAYAAFHGARLLRWDERVWAVRGAERRPYPWGDPFGEGNANTKEEVLGRPCAVGLYRRDVTPDGVYDLAGNVGEWTADTVGDEGCLHPGAWDQPSMAAWAKALTTERPHARWAGLGFRLARD